MCLDVIGWISPTLIEGSSLKYNHENASTPKH